MRDRTIKMKTIIADGHSDLNCNLSLLHNMFNS